MCQNLNSPDEFKEWSQVIDGLKSLIQQNVVRQHERRGAGWRDGLRTEPARAQQDPVRLAGGFTHFSSPQCD